MTGYRVVRRVLTPALTCLALSGCVTEMKVSAMHPASGALVAQPPPGMASIVFVRPYSSCDTAGYPTVVDENGHFLGNAGPNTTFVVNVPAGHHVFYTWDYIDERRDDDLFYTPVGALVVDAAPGTVTNVAILVPEGGGLRCITAAGYELVMASDGYPSLAEFDAWRREANPVEPEVQKGEKDLDRHRPIVCAHLLAGRRHLHPLPPTTCSSAGPVALAPHP